MLNPAVKIEAIFFDMNGTLRRRQPDEGTRLAATQRFLEILGKEEVPDLFWDELALRKKRYDRWAQEKLFQITEEELWCKWLLPEYPSDRIGPAAAALTLALSERKGRTFPLPGAEAALKELKKRGYRLGLISNSISSLDIPHSLEEFHWQELFEVVILSGMVRYRKPASEPFLEAVTRMGVTPGVCAYVGNHFSKDLVGCKRAGFCAGILLQSPEKLQTERSEPGYELEAVIHNLTELLDIFPEIKEAEDEKA
jgi:putative hydrolase of the HAD superfamily